MKTFTLFLRLVLPTAVSLLLLTTLLTHFSPPAQATQNAQLEVCGTCLYTTIQSAVDAANTGDTIRVAQGTYQDIVTSPGLLTSTVIITKNLTLIGGYSPDFQTHDPNLYETIVDGQNIGKGFYVSGSYAHIEGFTIINGYTQGILVRESIVNNAPAGATLVNNHIRNNVSGVVIVLAEATINNNTITGNSERGIVLLDTVTTVTSNTVAQNNGGIYATRSAVTIEGNQILSNTAEYGGGLALDSSTQFTVTHNTIRGNQATLYNGGGIATGWEGGSAGIISYNEIVDNESADHGGGIIIYESAEVTISNNQINQNSTQWGGGGIHVRDGSAPIIIEGNTLFTNTASYGGGILIVDANNEALLSQVLISQNDIRFNQITGEEYDPGGIYVNGGMVTIVNNVIGDNDNRGVKGINYTEIELINNTIVGNGVSAIEMHAWPTTSTVPMTTTLINNIIADHPNCAFFGFYGAVFAVHHNNVVGHELDGCGAVIIAQSGNIYTDPLFVNAAEGDYDLQADSPAIDNGTAGIAIPTIDIEGTFRPQGEGIDMGAYEASPWTQVSQLGFGQPTNHFIHALEVWNNQLYAAATNYEDSGATVWRYAPQTNDWVRVSERGFSMEHRAANNTIIGMQSFKRHLYASTGWSGENTGQLWRTADGTTWTPVTTNGFGNPHNLSLTAFGVYQDYLYIGTGNEEGGSEIWRSATGAPGDWTKVSPNQTNTNNHIATSFLEFGGYLYVALENDDEGVAIWRTNNGTTWTQVNQYGFGDAANGLAGGLGVFDGYLYLGVENRTTGAQLWRSNNGTTWQQVVGDGFGSLANSKFDMVVTFADALYVATSNGSGLQVWRSEDGTTFTPVSRSGFGNPNNVFTLWSSATAVYQNQLYIGAGNWIDGASIWRLNKADMYGAYLPLITR